jgi:hypothetical protein
MTEVWYMIKGELLPYDAYNVNVDGELTDSAEITEDEKKVLTAQFSNLQILFQRLQRINIVISELNKAEITGIQGQIDSINNDIDIQRNKTQQCITMIAPIVGSIGIKQEVV